MSGHGHVTPNPEGSKARCGGPALCPHCQREQRVLNYIAPWLSDDELATRLEQKGLSEPTIADLIRRRDEAEIAMLLDDLLSGRDWDG